jgi:hypothetical protein
MKNLSADLRMQPAQLALFLIICGLHRVSCQATTASAVTPNDEDSNAMIAALLLAAFSAVGIVATLWAYLHEQKRQNTFRAQLTGDNPLYNLARELPYHFLNQDDVTRFKECMDQLWMVYRDLYGSPELSKPLIEEIAQRMRQTPEEFGLTTKYIWGSHAYCFAAKLPILACASLAKECRRAAAETNSESVIRAITDTASSSLEVLAMDAFIQTFFKQYFDKDGMDMFAPWETIFNAIDKRKDRFQNIIAILEKHQHHHPKKNKKTFVIELAKAFKERLASNDSLSEEGFQDSVNQVSDNTPKRANVRSFSLHATRVAPEAYASPTNRGTSA